MKNTSVVLVTGATVEEETPAQAEARATASREINKGRFSGIWESFQQVFGSAEKKDT